MATIVEHPSQPLLVRSCHYTLPTAEGLLEIMPAKGTIPIRVRLILTGDIAMDIPLSGKALADLRQELKDQ